LADLSSAGIFDCSDLQEIAINSIIIMPAGFFIEVAIGLGCGKIWITSICLIKNQLK
jgi:hypothetical protein